MKKNLALGIISIVGFNFLGVAICTLIDAITYDAADATFASLLLSVIVPVVMYVIYYNHYFAKRYESGFKMKFGYTVIYWLVGLIGCAGLAILASFLIMGTGMESWFCWPIISATTLAGMILGFWKFRPAN